MSRDDWKASAYGAEARERSMSEAQERIREAERELNDRRCRCTEPVPDLRSYFGVRPCRMCQRPINPNGGGR